MSAESATAPRATVAPDREIKGDGSRRVMAEQLELLCRQWVRLPVPILLLCVYVAYLGWGYVDMATVLGWSVCTVGILMARSVLIIRLRGSEQLSRQPEVWARRLTVLAALSGVVSGSAAPLFFPALPADRQALLTMVMCCWVAGGMASSSAYPRAYYVFAVPLFAQIAVVWAAADSPGAWFILILLTAFLAVMMIFVRDMERVVVESIELRFENESLLAQKEELIGLLRAAFEKAEGARSKAEEANRSKTQFVAAASHDLRQPLHALSLLTELLNEMTQDPRVREVGRHIGQSVESLDRLFGALLDLSKLDAGILTAELRDVDLVEFFERLTDDYRSKAQEKHLGFEAQCEPVWVHADPILLERIVRNLLENAIRFTDTGRVVLRARRSGADATIAISDTGPGIPESEHARVFEEFYQLHNPARNRSKGLGLGLSIVRRVVDLLGYRIDVQSTLGQGATFTLTLPGAIIERESRAAQKPTTAAADVGGLRVLVIEDDAEARLAMDMTLQRWGCEPLLAESLEDARALFKARAARPDVIVSDFGLAHGANGIQTIQALRAELGPVPAALVTGDISSERLLELRASGLPVLHKPVRPEVLRQMLHQLARDKPPR